MVAISRALRGPVTLSPATCLLATPMPPSMLLSILPTISPRFLDVPYPPSSDIPDTPNYPTTFLRSCPIVPLKPPVSPTNNPNPYSLSSILACPLLSPIILVRLILCRSYSTSPDKHLEGKPALDQQPSSMSL